MRGGRFFALALLLCAVVLISAGNASAQPLTITTASLPSWTVGVPYSQTLTATGGTPPYTWSIVPPVGLPAGLSLNPATGAITGTPTTAGTSAFTARVNDSVSATASKDLSITINAAPGITTVSLPAGAVGVVYSQTLTASGGTPPLTWSISAGSLPTGLSLNPATGAITGAPTAAGTSNFTAKVTDAVSAFATKDLSITINPAPTITTTSLPNWTVGVAYSQTLTATGGTPPYTWSISAGSPPAGLSLNPATGAITGTPTTAGTSNFTVRVTDTLTATGAKDFSITVNPAPAITTTSLPAWTVGIAYSQTLTATGGTPPLTWSISAGSLPVGLSLNPTTGAITGAPTTAGLSAFTAQVTDSVAASATKDLSITINAAPSVTTTSLPTGAVGVAYSQTLTASGGTPPLTWAISAGSLPVGLSLNPATGAITGTPTTAGASAFTARVTDSLGVAGTKDLSITINLAPTITTTSLPNWTVGVAYSQTLTATGGTPPYTWSISAGLLPVGLSLNPATGAITGTPTTAGTSNFTVRVTDSLTATGTKDFSITINAAPAITTASLPAWTVGIAYSQALAATGGTPPYTWSISAGSLPAGLTLSGNTITGTPTTAGTSSFTVQVNDSVTASATKDLSITINPAPSITTTSFLTGAVGVAYSQTLAASGGTPPLTWSISAGSLPAGLSLNPVSGAITGMPATAGASAFTARAADSVGSAATKDLSITINPAPTITTTALPDWTVGVAYSQTLAATSGTPPYTWSISAGSLPGGLSLNLSTGAITGTPTSTGPFGFTARVTDSLTATGFKDLTITINPAVTVTTAALGNGVVGVAYSQALTAAGGTPPYTWAISAGALPAGLTLTGNTISGTPTTVGTFDFTAQVTDSVSATATKPLSITIGTALTITTASLANGVLGTAYSQPLGAAGGTPPYTWSINAGSLPGGLSLTGNSISGTPNATGTFNFTVRVTDSASATATKPLSIAINPALTITTSSLPNWTVAIAGYSQTLAATGGWPPYTWSISAGSLPAGLSLNPAIGAVTGTPITAGTSSFTVQVTDSVTATASQALSITINPAPSITTTSLPIGAVGVAYSQTLVATGGTPPLTWSISAGSLLAGLSLNPATGAIAGTPTTPGTSNFTARVSDAAAAFATKDLSITINPAPTITTTSLPAWTLNIPYSQTLTATSGTPPYTWLISAGSLPGGLSLDPLTGTITGTPTVAGTFGFTARVTDSLTATGFKDLTITISPAVTITTTALGNGVVGVAYSQALAATGGTPPYTWSITAGSLAPGLNLSGATISGTPAAAGTFDFTVQVTDSVLATATKPLSITIGTALTITTASLANGVAGTAYSQTLSAAGGTPPYTWSVSAGSLPAGLTLAGNTISGTPAAVGASTFTVRVSDAASASATKVFTISVAPAITITTPSLPNGVVAVAYLQMLSANGGWSPYIWSVSSGSLPAGLTLSSSGVISGAPTAAGAATFTIQVTDSISASASRQFTITIAGALTITTTSLASGVVGAAYSQVIAASGGAPPYTFSLTAGSLPPGLALSPAGIISGTPTAAAVFSFTVQATDAASSRATANLSITIASGLTITTPAALPTGAVSTPYSQALAPSGGTPPYTWSISAGALPAGLSLAPSTGLISGTPTTTGSFSFTVQVTDGAASSTTKVFTLTIVAALTITSTSPLPSGAVSSAYSQALAALGGTAPYTWSISAGALPGGLSLNASTGVISGTPTAAGASNFTVQVTDSAGATVTKAFVLTIVTGLTITGTSPLPPGGAGRPYLHALTAVGGATPYSWSISAGALPAGLTLSSSGTISGTPNAAGAFQFTVQVTDAAGASASKALSLTIGASLIITTSSALPGGAAGQVYSQALAAIGGTPPYTWSVSAGTLPAGLTLNSSTGVIGGTPTAAGTFSFSVQVSDSAAASFVSSFTLAIGLPAVPALNASGLPATANPAQQMSLRLTLASAYPLEITGQAAITFAPDAVNPGDDPAIAFSSGGRSVAFTIPANTTGAVFTDRALSEVGLQTGTVAGAVTVSFSLRAGGVAVSPAPAPQVIRIDRAAPVIRSVRLVRSAAGFEVQVTAFSTSRDLTRAVYRFTAAPGADLRTTEVTVTLADASREWYQGSFSAPFGSQFTLVQPFSVQGDVNAFSSVSVVLTNTVGDSQAVSAP